MKSSTNTDEEVGERQAQYPGGEDYQQGIRQPNKEIIPTIKSNLILSLPGTSANQTIVPYRNTIGLDAKTNALGLEGGLILHEDGRKRKATKLHGNNLDTYDMMIDTSTLISPSEIQGEKEPNFLSASPTKQAP